MRLCLLIGVAFLFNAAVKAQEPTGLAYPLAVASVEGGEILIVDTDVPGIFRLPQDGAPELWVEGPKRFREPLNRPRSIVVATDGTVLVGDSASRDVYRVEEDGSLNPLTDAKVGIPTSLAVGEEGTVYVADLETRSILRFPLGGGDPEVFAPVNARGLHWDGEKLWGVTQTEQQVVTFDAEGKIQPLVEGRQMQFPHEIVVTDEGVAYVTDGYKKAIWQVTAEGEAQIWHEGEPMQNPVGLSLDDGGLLVADPHAKTIFRFDLETKEVTDLTR